MRIRQYIKPVALIVLAFALLTVCVMKTHADERSDAVMTAAQQQQVSQDVFNFT